ncbi:16S rRNA m(2)G-966 methyltransferase [Bisgaardia hudsonensis]|uniref:Ribosomal RNA small subunit methyltransferase D n=1 Tax=Bisgaardia hudsonensis TaxID=109472 RepID=A0A4R2MT86_9PAST|nr:16S rRNA (guanine(966)-N(2))-methyltransferase RsmD [Bisgaardia hudsonensis]QLB12151.1 16S rRNA (guanine(966)-N(2))-methyltransferase RsmD [Bisgaardia hudsonensis]TCP11510.1 16S rRNA m(2)G-966 methyltransferase [Bisgaardia hudsonensis]
MKKNRQQNSLKATGEVRIIAGNWRGRKLPVLSLEGLRPTGDRVKEMVFNWLMPYIVDSVCLDCFAGSGSLGFEALSRQAKQVIFLELDKKVANQLSHNLKTLKCSSEKANVINQNSLLFLATIQSEPQFDLVFLDPPFHFDLVDQTIFLLLKNNWLKPNALIYIETEKGKIIDVPNDWVLLKEKNTGQVTSRLFQHQDVSVC